MAAYATFKHVEIFNVGKTKKRVVRPPVASSTDIFGGEAQQTPRAVKNHMASNIFSADKAAPVKNIGEHPRRAQKNIDSYTRLFGESERAFPSAKNHMKSNIPFGASNDVAQKCNTNGSSHRSLINCKGGSVSTSASSSVTSSTENLKINSISKTDGAAYNGDISINVGNPVIMKNRIPPGGFSAGLW